ncbi:hypothetical protein [uncultured Paludibaculum sp.]|uniref:hypothetical protein n=1 Tax=uncultured Paludibaculum sp. TaxID=1765020 RepID=UPI002AAAA496|nr:hypothetical protein [uncultured Paludibaculum sp.]
MVWLTNPLTYYCLLAVGLSLSLYLFVSVKRENAALREQLTAERKQIDEAMDVLRQSLNRVELALEEATEMPTVPTASATPPDTSVNISKRGQALRMHRRGESPEQIAAALQMPRSEVELLLKVQRAVLGQC